MFREIKLQEAAVLAQVITTDHTDECGNTIKGKDLNGCLKEMELIDDLLSIMKSKSLLNKKRGLKRVISGRIEMSLKNSSIQPGLNNVQLN